MKRAARWLVWWGLTVVAGALQAASVGDDVVAVFARAAKGEPLRYVAIGGSITQASGDGWAGDWLRAQFPESLVTVVNSGMSATGSALGVFRAERDIIAHQPDLVAIEYCVNDGGLTDEQAVRYVETLVVRLKSLPQPPAIIMVEAAAREGVNLARHRRVARHYGLLEVDLQAAVDARLAERGETWDAFFSDNVHPNKAGHAFYAEVMQATLRPLVERAIRSDHVDTVVGALPVPLSEKPLLLDARLVPLQGVSAPGWRVEPALPSWWNRFFQGVLAADAPGATLTLPVRGTTFGLLHGLSPDHGTFYASVDGALPAHVSANHRSGYGYQVLATDLPAREHRLTVVLPARDEANPRNNGPVKLGYLLVAGETAAVRESSPAGGFGPDALRDLRFEPLPAAAWSWAGPFAVRSPDGGVPVDGRAGLAAAFLPEPGQADFNADALDWRPAKGAGSEVNFRALTGDDAPAVCYARATLDGGANGGEAILSLTVDYYCRLWLNGEPILTFDGPHPRPAFLPVKLRPGANNLFIKTAAGSAGHSLRIDVARTRP